MTSECQNMKECKGPRVWTDMEVQAIARVAHETNRAYCESLGDYSLVNWEVAPQWQRESVIAGVRLHLANPHTTPRQSHEAWLAFKEKDGWKYGPVKDADKKEHPCFLPYDELPEQQRRKDFFFKAIVTIMSSNLYELDRTLDALAKLHELAERDEPDPVQDAL